MDQRVLIETIADAVAPHLSFNLFDHLIAELIEIGAVDADLAEYAVDYYKDATEGEDVE